MARRFFVGIELGELAKGEVLRVQGELGKRAGDVYHLVEEEKLHLTLYFCGDTDEAAMVAIGDRIGGMDLSGFDVRLDGLKRLPADDVPKVLAIGVRSAGRELAKLQQRVHDVCFGLSAVQEIRPYTPHVTFARLSRGVPSNAKIVKRSLAALGEITSVEWSVSEVVVWASEEGRYEVVRRIGLVAL
ncbi:2'-5' RNA ligase [Armatimonadetes bacterium Uphvl-Ar1]|nr:2'-5' RNA ligase [Armatimonadetes bacterium Uphvl-Ar1]